MANPTDRFFNFVKKTEYCWLWTGGTGKNGYGRFWVDNRLVNAHRFIWEITNGKIPDGYYVCHKCDIRNCVNPEHLFLGTHNDNMRDMVNKNHSTKGNRHSSKLYPELVLRGENHPMAKLTNMNISQIKELNSNGLNSYEIAKQFNVGRKTIQNILRKKSWKHIKE